MLADRIKGGTLELGGAGNGNGVAKVLNADGNEIVRLDKDGVYAKGKYVCANTDGSQTATLSNGKLTFKTESYEVVIRAGAIGGLTGLMIYPEQGAVRTKFLSIGDKLSARFDNISLLASGKTTIGGASLEVQRDGKGYSGKTGKAVFSDGTYLEYVNGFLVGGNTKPRALPWAKSFCPFRAYCCYELLGLSALTTLISQTTLTSLYNFVM